MLRRSTSSLRFVFREVRVEVVDCLSHAIGSEKRDIWKIQKNKQMPSNLLISSSSLRSKFGTPTHRLCDTTSWFVTNPDQVDPVSSTSDTYKVLRLSEKQPGFTDLLINTEHLEQPGKSFVFNIRVKLGAGEFEVVNPNYLAITLMIDCWDETFASSFEVITNPSTQINLRTHASDFVELRFKRTVETQITVVVDLTEVFKFQSDYAFCKPTMAETLDSKGLPTFSGLGSASLSLNPTTTLNQDLKPLLSVSYGNQT